MGVYCPATLIHTLAWGTQIFCRINDVLFAYSVKLATFKLPFTKVTNIGVSQSGYFTAFAGAEWLTQSTYKRFMELKRQETKFSRRCTTHHGAIMVSCAEPEPIGSPLFPLLVCRKAY